jgi:excinuclease ABC subunit A
MSRLPAVIPYGKIGPHMRCEIRHNEKLIETLRTLQGMWATVNVIEHDEAMIRSADHIIDLGPGGGDEGGRIVAWGPPQSIIQNPRTLKNPKTAEYLKRYLGR